MAEGGGIPLPTSWFSEDWWEDEGGIFTADPGGSRKPDYARQGWVAKTVPWFSKEAWRIPAQRALLIADAFRIWREGKMADPRSNVARKLARTAEGREVLRATQQKGTPPTTTAPPRTTADRLLDLLRIAAEQYAKARQQSAAARAQRQQLKLLTLSRAGGSSMPFPQLSTGFGFSPNLSLPTMTGGGGFSGFIDALPALGQAAAPLIARLFEQEATEAPDILERLGMATGLEGAVEREATFWLPSAAGVRANPEIMARNPVTGRLGTWRFMGRPVLYSGDLATCKRVNRISSRVARVARRRGSLPRRTRRR